MQIKLLAIVRGSEFQGDPGSVEDWPDEFAQSLIDGGYAEAVGSDEPQFPDPFDNRPGTPDPDYVEVADEPEAETAVTHPRRSRRASHEEEPAADQATEAREAADSE